MSSESLNSDSGRNSGGGNANTIDDDLIASSGLSRAELQEFLEIFNLVDLDHGGTISKEELGQLMTTLGIRASKVELETMINEIDVEGTGEIDFKSEYNLEKRKR